MRLIYIHKYNLESVIYCSVEVAVNGGGESRDQAPRFKEDRLGGHCITTARTPLLLFYNISDYLVAKCNGEGGKTNCVIYHVDYQCQKWNIYRGRGKLVYLESGTL